jgi:hypothetical protein
LCTNHGLVVVVVVGTPIGAGGSLPPLVVVVVGTVVVVVGTVVVVVGTVVVVVGTVVVVVGTVVVVVGGGQGYMLPAGTQLRT